jgi:hypothetical protein
LVVQSVGVNDGGELGVADRAVLGPLDRCGASGSEVAAVGGDLDDATSSVTPDATSKDEGGLHPLRIGLANWLAGMRGRVQLDPRRWTPVGWANAAYLVLVSPPGED